jgi:hypothetical protein
VQYYIYIKPDGYPAIMDCEIKLELFPGYQFFGVTEDHLYFRDKMYVGGQWVSSDTEPQYLKMRRYSYPPGEELMQALWRAMDAGVLPKVPGFYDKIDEVNKRFPPK